MAKKVAKKKPRAREPRTESGQALVIVESPAKAKTINKFLGKGYVVKACKGHVRDLPPRQYGVDPGRHFEPTYEVLAGAKKTLADLEKAAGQAEMVYLATDLDREGEAIAWHLAEAMKLEPEKIRRVVFNEITKGAIAEAFAHPHEINMAKVEAQQARRILDRVVGYELSPLLWKKVAKGLSAGRVQSVAVRLMVEREAEIRSFAPQESWILEAVLTPATDQAEELAGRYTAFKQSKQEEGAPPTARERTTWLGESGCIGATLVELAGKPFKPAGKLDKDKPITESFTSAVDEVRPVAEALGFSVRETISNVWESYAHLGLKQVELSGEFSLSQAPALAVKSVETKRSSSRPSAPFATATLQQAAANQLRFPTSKTMRVAQALYEGIDIQTGEGSVGLITYMRTDSVNLSAESVKAARDLIGTSFGGRYLPASPNRYGSSKKAQEAHEAIRPTDVTRTPEAMRGHMTSDQLKLYTMIWNRFVACQMKPAEWDLTTVLVSAKTPHGEAIFKTTGRVLAFDGFYRVAGMPKSNGDQILPPMVQGQAVSPVAIEPTQKYTSPPPRFTEASLVKSLEAQGIGRPSTYAAIIKTIQDRGYVEQVDRRFYSTARGEIVTEKLVHHFPQIMDVRFTSHVEDELDKIEEKQLDWHDVLHEFYDPFKESLARAHEEMQAVRAEKSKYTCDTCGLPMVYRLGKNGRFLACSGYPECKVSKDIDRDGKIIEPVYAPEPCDLCGAQMVLRKSRRGPFLGCSKYPECTNIKPCTEEGVPLKKVEPDEIKQDCQDCGAPMQVKFSGSRAFLGCSKYPTCKATTPLPDGVWVEKPKPESAGVRCDKCGRPVVIRRSRRGPFLSCSGFPKCRNAMPMDKLDHLKQLEASGAIPDAPKEVAAKGNGVTRGKPKRLTAEEIAALGPPPQGFAWTRTGRPVVETWPDGPLTCFECGGEMTVRSGRFGPFYSCANCKAAANLRGAAKKRAETEVPAPDKPKPIETDVQCEDCGSKMLLRMGRTGRFLGCSAYPKCKKTQEVPPGMLREVADAAKATA